MKRRLIPKHLNGVGILAFALQIFLASLVLYAALGVQFGWLVPNDPEQVSRLPGPAVIIWSLAMIIAPIGIYLDRWWAYFLELAGIAIVMFALNLTTNDKPLPHIVTLFEWPDWANRVMDVALLLAMASWLISSGIRSFRASRTARLENQEVPPNLE